MRVSVFSTNLSFFGPIQEALQKAGHKVHIGYKDGMPGVTQGLHLSDAFWRSDVVFVEFCQVPMRQVLDVFAGSRRAVVVARMHRIEMYNALTQDPDLNWDRVDVLMTSAEHVTDRFMQKRQGLSKPKSVLLHPTNVADESRFFYKVRNWKPPFRICMLGNFVPKKRQYTAIQYMYDLKQEFGRDFRLEIVGARGQWGGYGNPEYYENCKDLIADLDLQDVVTIFDKVPHDEVPNLLAREHAIISNSNEEGTHVAIAEAAMTGCLPLCNCWRGVQAVYPDPQVAWHFRSGTEFVGLCRRIKTFQPAELEARSQEVAKAAQERYAARDRYDKLVQYLEEMVQKKRPSP